MIRSLCLMLVILVFNPALSYCQIKNYKDTDAIKRSKDSNTGFTYADCNLLIKKYSDSIANLYIKIDKLEKANKILGQDNEFLADKMNHFQDSLTKFSNSKKYQQPETRLNNKPTPPLITSNRANTNNPSAGDSYSAYKVSYPSQNVGMMLYDKNKQKIRSLDNAVALLKSQDRTVLLVTNGGIYREDNSPKGLYIENGKELSALDTATLGYGNFYIQPNGIFMLLKNSAKIIKTSDYKQYIGKIKYATQSGPLLVINGEINPIFDKASSNKNIRSGVGIDRNGEIVFAISNNPVSFYDFATIFAGLYSCRNALYLDGAISKMFCPSLKRNDGGGNFGVIVFVSK